MLPTKILAKTIVRYGRVDLLCIDELGYMELKRGAELLFQVLPEREGLGGHPSNESFPNGWTEPSPPQVVPRDR